MHTRIPWLPPARSLGGLGLFVLLAWAATGCSSVDAAPRQSGTDGAFSGAPRVEIVPERLLAVPDGFQMINDITADGRAIVVSGARMGRLGTIDLVTGDSTWLTETVEPYHPTWTLEAVAAHDGRIAYHEYTNDTNEWTVKVAHPDGTQRALADVDTYWNIPVAWSPAGDRLLTVAAGAGSGDRVYAYDPRRDEPPLPLYSVPLGGPLSSVGYSSDGAWIAFTRVDDPDTGATAPYLLRSDGSEEVRFEGLPQEARVVGWSPDGGRVLYERFDGASPSLWRQDVRGPRAVGTPELVQWDRWDMETIGLDELGSFYYAVDTSADDIFTLALGADGMPSGTPFRRPAAAEAVRLEYSPDGGSLVYLRRAGMQQGAADRRIVVESLEQGSTAEIDLGVPIRYVSRARWSPDGRSLLVRVVDDRERYAFYRYDLATAALDTVRVWNGPGVVGQPEPTPDGSGVVFVAREPDDPVWRVDRLDLETGEERTIARLELTEEEGSPGPESVSPDGRRMAFATSKGIRVVDLATGRIRSVVDTDLAFRSAPAWHPDGRHLYFASNPRDPDRGSAVAASLYRADLDTGEFLDLGIEMDAFDRIDVAPDGSELSFGAVTRGPTEIWRIQDVFDAPLQSASNRQGPGDGGS